MNDAEPFREQPPLKASFTIPLNRTQQNRTETKRKIGTKILIFINVARTNGRFRNRKMLSTARARIEKHKRVLHPNRGGKKEPKTISEYLPGWRNRSESHLLEILFSELI